MKPPEEILLHAPAQPAPQEPYKRCDGVSVVCSTLRERLQDGYSKGLNAIHMVNFSTGEYVPDILAYKSKASDSGIVLNFCPFCGARLNLKYVAFDAPYSIDEPPFDSPEVA